MVDVPEFNDRIEDKPLVIFGTGQLAEIALNYFRTDSEHEVIALTVDDAFLPERPRMGLPVVPFESLSSHFPPEECNLFVALAYRERNGFRRERFLAGRSAGYRFPSYVSSRAIVMNPYNIGENCFILEGSVVQPFVRVGDNATIWSGTQVGHHSEIGNHVFAAPSVAISGNVTIRDNVFLGINSTVRDGITIGEEAIVGAGALIMNDVPPRCVIAPRGSVPSSGGLR